MPYIGGPDRLSFNPLLHGSPFHAFWAEDPAWTPPAADAEVLSWRNDGSNGTAATGTTGTVPLYRTTGMNGRPSLDFLGTDEILTLDAGSALTNPVTYILAASWDAADSDKHRPIASGTGETSGAGRSLIDCGGFADTWRLWSGTPLASGTGSTGIHVFTFVYGSSHVLRVDGSTLTSGSDSGSNTHGDWWGIGGNVPKTGGYYFNGDIAFFAAYDSDITGEDWFAGLESGLMTMYGI